MIIIGDGIAARSVVHHLLGCEFIESIGVISSKRTREGYGQLASSMYTGVWGPALRCLDNLGAHDPNKFHSITDVKYCSTNGTTLASPLKGLVPFRSQCPPYPSSKPISLSFIKNKDLLDSLPLDGTKGLKLFDASVTGITRFHHTEPQMVHLTTGESLPCDLLVVGDGTFSATKNLLGLDKKNENITENVTGTSHHLLEHRGYRVFRGHTRIQLHKYGFQSWGPSARFASVPTKEGNAWFAAISINSLPSSPPDLHSPTTISSPSRMPQGPFINGSRFATHEEVSHLQERFSSWHAPISDLIALSHSLGYRPPSNPESRDENNVTLSNANYLSDSVIACDAYASTRSSLWGGGFFENLSHTFASTSHHMKGKNIVSNSRKKGHIVFVGDANFTLDPILAQGAGVAIEEGAWLANVLKKQAFMTKKRERTTIPMTQGMGGSQSGSKASTHNTQQGQTSLIEDDLTNALTEFTSTRSSRLLRLSILSDLSQSMGHLSEVEGCETRNMFLNAIPSVIKGVGFDWLMKQSVK